MKNRGLFLLISVSIFFILLSSFGSAVITCSDSSQRIMRISASTNAHGEVWDGASNYPVELCYDQIFGTKYVPESGENPHLCVTGSANTVLKLSSSTNAHAEGPTGTNYNINVCYGKLSCVLRDAGCQSGESAVASLSDNTNAHLALGSDATYTKKICCALTSGGIISGVKHRGIYFANTDLSFKYTPSDPSASVSWTIESNNEPDFVSNQKEFVKQFATAGQRTITVKEKIGDGIPKEKQIAILIINSPGIFAFIEKPIHKQYVINGELKTDYSARESFVVNSESGTGCSGNVRCVAGNCPTKVENSPPGCSNQIPVNPLTGGSDIFSNIEFNWNFPMNGAEQIISGSGEAYASGTQGYSIPGDYRIDLLLKYPSISGVQQLFQREFFLRGASCTLEGQYFIELNTDGTEKNRLPTSTSVTSPPACAGADHIIGPNPNDNGKTDDCCPAGYTCRPAESGVLAGCYPSDIKSCGEYKTQSTCEGGSAWKTDELKNIPDSVHGVRCGDDWANGQCINNVICNTCAWDSGTSKCYLQREDRPSNPTTCDPIRNPPTLCNYRVLSESECKDGFKRISIEAILDHNSAPDLLGICESRTVTLPCGRSVLELPFFGTVQFLIALLVIVIIYLIMHRAHSNKRRRLAKRG